MASTGYPGTMNYSAWTPIDNTGDAYTIFRSGYKNVRFNVTAQQKVTLDHSMAYNMPGLAFALYQDASLWEGLLAFNGLSDPLTDVYPGLALQIPTKSDLVAYVTKQNKTSPAQTITI